ncbi:LSU ribosomal protein L10p (P0) [hydrothermal vent metagenome]|uniref:LSU ribosomal protein L10p (P0) n=1 Tax=hydrothermal vent metagenome TaxID=652676 RepID=A0A3B1CS18_9ZZZZ
MVFTDYKGLTVAQVSEMRRLLRASEIDYKVVKNTLASIAADDTPVSVAKEQFIGPVGIAIGYDDPVLVAKKVLEYAKGNETLGVKGGVIEGKFMDLKDLKSVASLPPRNVQLAMLAGAMAAPMSKMASLLQATIRKFGYALNGLKEKKGQ